MDSAAASGAVGAGSPTQRSCTSQGQGALHTAVQNSQARQHVRLLLPEGAACHSPGGLAPASVASSAGTLAAAASPTLAVLAVTARELLQEIEAAAADSPASVAHSSRSSRRKGHKSSNKSKHRHRRHAEEQEQPCVQLEQQAGGSMASPGFFAARTLQEPQHMQDVLLHQQQLQREAHSPQHKQGLLGHPQQQCQQQQHEQQAAERSNQARARPDSGVSTSDSVGWSAVLQKYELHKLHMAQLLSNIEQQPQHQQQQQHTLPSQQSDHLLSAHGTTGHTDFSHLHSQQGTRADHTAAAAAAAAAGTSQEAAAATWRPHSAAQASRAGSASRKQRAVDGSGAAAAAMAMQAAVLDPGLRMRIQQLRGSSSDGFYGAGRSADAGFGSTPTAATAAAAGVSAAHESAAESDLQYLLAERHLVAALLKHLAAVVAADAAASAHNSGLHVPGGVWGFAGASYSSCQQQQPLDSSR